MKTHLVILISIFVLCLFSCSSSSDTGIKNGPPETVDTITSSDTQVDLSDTIEIWDSIAGNPFLFLDWEVSAYDILKILPNEATLERSLRASDYVENGIDTVIKMKFGSSIIEYVTAPSVAYIESATIMDDDVELRRNIRIGDSYEEVRQKIPSLKRRERKGNTIWIYHGEATNTLIFEFKDDKLFRVTYWPYTG
jgi:hypothetical protein